MKTIWQLCDFFSTKLVYRNYRTITLLEFNKSEIISSFQKSIAFNCSFIILVVFSTCLSVLEMFDDLRFRRKRLKVNVVLGATVKSSSNSISSLIRFCKFNWQSLKDKTANNQITMRGDAE